jgi:hypothetical protein
MEALLWTDIARFYHAGLKNLCGPFDRSYGMDMRHYVAVLGEWVWLVTGHAQAPFPTLDQPFAHAGDLCFAPCAAILGAAVPSEVVPHFFAFQGERQIERVIADSPQRVATAWLASGLMIGAERTTFGKRGYPQFHPGTIYWKIGADEVGWIRLMNAEPLDARASANRLDIAGQDEIWFQISAPGVQIESIHAARWQLPGLEVTIQINVSDVHIEHTTHFIEVRYHAGAGQPISCVLTTRLA